MLITNRCVRVGTLAEEAWRSWILAILFTNGAQKLLAIKIPRPSEYFTMSVLEANRNGGNLLNNLPYKLARLPRPLRIIGSPGSRNGWKKGRPPSVKTPNAQLGVNSYRWSAEWRLTNNSARGELRKQVLTVS